MRNSFFKSRWIFYIVFVLTVVLLIFIFYPRPEGWKVKKVIDGDSVLLENGETVRYIGIDTPEKEELFFWEAAKANQEMLKSGEITLEYDIEKQDRWGRILAYVWVDSILVNAELLKNGLAWMYVVFPNLKYRDRFISLQKQAREKRIGVWSIKVSPERYYVASKRSRKFVFHRPGCEWAKKIKSENLIRFETRGEALDSGYSPCRTCKP